MQIEAGYSPKTAASIARMKGLCKCVRMTSISRSISSNNALGDEVVQPFVLDPRRLEMGDNVGGLE
ncbi:hypothetical protein GGD40_001079 [Paraburkholderia bryophila]|uniref:Uncharacterized protein n=1 Tax=Paraburkholderia bryophila TaxID=420952 RepID=A0A7Y9WJT4_9BURK|nr:hypothetical protein [Paraburkholderia bryophila]